VKNLAFLMLTAIEPCKTLLLTDIRLSTASKALLKPGITPVKIAQAASGVVYESACRVYEGTPQVVNYDENNFGLVISILS